ncbi:MAG: hypothetical protein KGI84_07775, partial [Elusimicrobia bacterium]|nr:hypothetical protein [Elusimicrobiota bacterium]
SQFVILKTGSLGPPAVIAGLPEAAAQIQDPRGWFRLAFVQAGAWPLPDGSHAVLFRQRRFRRPPFRGRVFHFQFYRSGPLAAKNMRIDLGRWDARAGDYPRVRVSAPQVLFRGLAVTNFALELNDVLLVPVKDEPGRQAWDDVRFLRIGRLKIVSARLSADDLRLFLENRAKKLNLSSLSMENEVLSLQGRFSAIPVSASARIALNHAPPRLDFSVLSASAAGLPLPVGWLGRMVPLSLSLAPNPEVPFAIDAGSVTMAGGSLRVGGG